eukprot:TRINITY_DN106433_c0_g1_i1.p1 TRINITY_DN106433_c0_g1~~TRINITY_DN106433_c0_g1_i1.p1  ORF type:complete len:197 (+),score=44.34 TRINITY_DN106433_c0_g1_i1:114-704(+)
MLLPDVALPEVVPSDYALRMRPVFMGMLWVIMLFVLAKLVVHDFLGASSLLLILLMGLSVVFGQYAVNCSAALLFCAVCVISAAFDITSVILYFHVSKYRLFDARASHLVWMAQATLVFCPAVLLAAAMLAYSMYVDCQVSAEERAPMRQAFPGYSEEGQARGRGFQASAPRTQAGRPPSPAKPFQGVGRKLGFNF